MSTTDYRIYRHIPNPPENLAFAPVDTDFRTGLSVRLHPVETETKGNVIKVEYYEGSILDASGNKQGTGDLIVRTDSEYHSDDVRIIHRTDIHTWIREDGTDGEQKVESKPYSLREGIRANKRRRSNVIDSMELVVVGYIAATETDGDQLAAVALGQSFMAQHNIAVTLWLRVGGPGLIQAVEADTTPWLDNVIGSGDVSTIRDYIVEQLS